MKKFEPKPRDNMSVTVNFRISKEADDQLLEIAKKENLNKAELIRQMIDHCLSRYMKEGEK